MVLLKIDGTFSLQIKFPSMLLLLCRKSGRLSPAVPHLFFFFSFNELLHLKLMNTFSPDKLYCTSEAISLRS